MKKNWLKLFSDLLKIEYVNQETPSPKIARIDFFK